jgi:hypothetical protein
MVLSHYIHTKLVRRTALALAVAAVAAPSAAAIGPGAPPSTRTDPATVELPAVEVNEDGFLPAQDTSQAAREFPATSIDWPPPEGPAIAVVFPSVEVNEDGFVTATDGLQAAPEFPATSINWAPPEVPGIKVVLPSVEVNGDGFLTAERVFGPNFPVPIVNWHAQSRGAPEFPSIHVNWSQPEASAPIVPVSTPGFDFGDAGIGAAVALGAALLAALGVLALRRNRRSATLA